MGKIIYYVATSIDGYIAGNHDDISQFIMQGEGVEKYQSDLAKFDTVIMGRKTYEFGYQYGLKPGQPAYPNMDHHIFSNSLKIDNLSESVKIEKLSIDRVKEIKRNSKTDIYLCGGGQFAGWLLENNMIDQLKLKLNPVVLGSGIKLFGGSTTGEKWELIDGESFSDGLQIITYDKRK
ncbi:dihydrofolate reductase family protein [Membranihabitans marinus]|uniref:dihydrofolate reductase family protein n=1 Tax=Membranihabitans marinus TaxID=1227546 RepID=UPI001F2C33D0|nr:dihydrofolate reductase family protein [Membranihabitans marinus]